LALCRLPSCGTELDTHSVTSATQHLELVQIMTNAVSLVSSPARTTSVPKAILSRTVRPRPVRHPELCHFSPTMAD
jgi:hypothetical protein